jgi:hypothetical protein
MLCDRDRDRVIVIVIVRLLFNSVVAGGWVAGWVGVSDLAASPRRIQIQFSKEYCSERSRLATGVHT